MAFHNLLQHGSQIPPDKIPGAFRFQAVRNQAALAVNLIFRLLVNILGNGDRFFQGLGDIDVEPVIHAGGDKLQSDKKKQPGGEKRHGDKGDHQLGTELCSKKAAASLKDKLRQIAEN